MFRVSLESCGCWGHRKEVKGIEELDAQEQAVPALQSQRVTQACDIYCCSGDQRSGRWSWIRWRWFFCSNLENWLKKLYEPPQIIEDIHIPSACTWGRTIKIYKGLWGLNRLKMCTCVQFIHAIAHAKIWPWYSTISTLPESTSALRRPSQGHEVPGWSCIVVTMYVIDIVYKFHSHVFPLPSLLESHARIARFCSAKSGTLRVLIITESQKIYPARASMRHLIWNMRKVRSLANSVAWLYGVVGTILIVNERWHDFIVFWSFGSDNVRCK